MLHLSSPEAKLMQAIPLRIITEEETNGRSIILHNSEVILLLQGGEQGVPDLCCGSCGVPLIRGISQSRFVALKIEIQPEARILRLTPGGDAGPLVISRTLPLTENSAFIEAVVLKCPSCRKLNDTSSGQPTVQ
jgi:hypothetical protein